MPPEKLTQLEPPGHSLSPREATATVGRWHSLLERDSTANHLHQAFWQMPFCHPRRAPGTLLFHPLPHLIEPRQ